METKWMLLHKLSLPSCQPQTTVIVAMTTYNTFHLHPHLLYILPHDNLIIVLFQTLDSQ